MAKQNTDRNKVASIEDLLKPENTDFLEECLKLLHWGWRFKAGEKKYARAYNTDSNKERLKFMIRLELVERVMDETELPERFLMYTIQPQLTLKLLSQVYRGIHSFVGELVLFLNTEGELWRTGYGRCCYPIERGSGRHKIIELLANEKKFFTAEDIEKKASVEDAAKHVKDMREQIEKYMWLDGRAVIQAVRSKGYRINPQCVIKAIEGRPTLVRV